jgi:RNA polymerase sigma-70 factor, ECF subfamily
VTRRQNPHLSTDGTDEFASLVRAAAHGDGASMERLLMRAQEVAFRFSLLVCGQAEDAEDVMQDALLRTYRHVRRIKRPEAFRTWLFRIVRNACLMKRRRRVGEPTRVESLDAAAAPGHADTVQPVLVDRTQSPASAAINSWLGRRLRRALAALPASYRVVVLLREVEGLSTREVAQVTGYSEANVKTRLHRARALLREQLEST